MSQNKGEIIVQLYDSIENLCKNNGISITQMCKETGISRASLSDLKFGRSKSLSAAALSKISAYFSVPINTIMGESNEMYQSKENKDGNTIVLPNKKIRMIPLYESVSAGFGALANDMIIDYVPLFIASDIEANETLCIKVTGNSMYPKIEDGDIVQVQRVDSVDSGKIAAILLDGEEGLVKRVVYGDDWIELQSINPEYPPKRFEGADVQRISVVGLVKKIIKDC